MALGREEREDHAATDEEPVGRAEEVRDDAELVAHLRAAEDDGVGALRLLREALEHVDLGADETAGMGRQAGRDVVDRGLLAVHDAEAVGDVGVGQARELIGEGAALGLVLARLTRVEAQVLQHGDVAVGQPRDDLLGGLPDRVAREGDVAAEQLGQAPDDRLERVLLLRRALGAAEVGDDDHLGAGIGQGLDRRDRRADATVVGDVAVRVERHVEVAADEHALAAHVPGEKVLGGLHVCSFTKRRGQSLKIGRRSGCDRAVTPGRRGAERARAPGDRIVWSPGARRWNSDGTQRDLPTRSTRSTRRLE